MEQRRALRDLHLELLFNVGIYLTRDYKIIVVILSLDGVVNFDMNEKQIILLLIFKVTFLGQNY